MIELLVAVIIGAFVGAVGVFALHSVTADRKRLDNRLKLSGEMRCAMQTITSDLDNFYRSRDHQRMRLTGSPIQQDDQTSGRITFYTVQKGAIRPGKPESDVYEVEYFLRRDENQSILMRRVWPNPHRQSDPGGILGPVAENITTFDIRFYDGLEWRDVWEEDKTIPPKMIEIHLAARQPGEPYILEQTQVLTFPRLPQPQQAETSAELHNTM